MASSVHETVPFHEAFDPAWHERMVFQLTLHQPWASLLAAGIKTIETRSWRTSWSGLIAIHAGKSTAAMHALQDPRTPLARAIKVHTDAFVATGRWCDDPFPMGCLVGIGYMERCERTSRIPAPRCTPRERVLGDFGPDRYGWMFSRLVALPAPMLRRGERGLHEITDDDLRNTLRACYASVPPTYEAAEALR